MNMVAWRGANAWVARDSLDGMALMSRERGRPGKA